MNISVSQNLPIQTQPVNTKKQVTFVDKNSSFDTFVSSNPKQNTQVSFKGLFSSLFGKKETEQPIKSSEYSYPNEISHGIYRVLEHKVPESKLAFLMTPKEIREILPTLQTDNFLATTDNQADGIYFADLDYQSSYSTGKENIFDILDNVAKYAHRYYERTGQDFIFALTDRDSVAGLQQAIRIMATSPSKKYEHVKLIPGVKLSFAHKVPGSDTEYTNSEMLVYGINPFSENIVNFVDNTIQKRKDMIMDFIGEVMTLYPEFSYSVSEFAKQNSMQYNRDFTISSLYEHTRKYVETTAGHTLKSESRNSKEVMQEVADILNGLNYIGLGSITSKESRLSHKTVKDSELNRSIREIFEKYSTHSNPDTGEVESASENMYNELIDCLTREPEQPTLAISQPYYFSSLIGESDSESYDKVLELVQDLQDESNGMLVAFESYSPAYFSDKDLGALGTTKEQTDCSCEKIDKIEKFNARLREKFDLYEVGGSLAAKKNI